MENYEVRRSVSRIQNAERLNFNVQSYRFEDLDLKIAVGRLPRRDQNILVLHLMGHKQRDIAKVCSISRSMVSRRLGVIKSNLERRLNG